MLRVPLSVKYEDGSGADVVAIAPDLIRFERHFDVPMVAFANEAPRVEWVIWLAWTTVKRKGLISADSDFDTWCESVSDIAFGDEAEAEVVPLESNQPTG